MLMMIMPGPSDADDDSNLKVMLWPPSPPPSPRMLNSRPPGLETFQCSYVNQFVCLFVKTLFPPKNNLMDFLLTRPVVPGVVSIDNLLIFILKMPMITIVMIGNVGDYNIDDWPYWWLQYWCLAILMITILMFAHIDDYNIDVWPYWCLDILMIGHIDDNNIDDGKEMIL